MFGLALLLPLAVPQGSVLVVDDDGGPGVDHTEIAAAVAAAADGDVLLIKDGVYEGFVLSNKSLVIAADSDVKPRISGEFAIESLGPNDSLTIRGLEFFAPLFSAGPSIEAGAGFAYFEDCRFLNGNLGQFGNSAAGLQVTGGQVALVGSELIASTGGLPAGGGDGLVITGGEVHVYDSVVTGGVGALGNAVDGGRGARVDGGFLFASGSTFLGGAGGDGVTLSVPFPPFQICYDGGNGGDGIEVAGGAFSALLDASALGAPGGISPAGCSPGTSGADEDAAPGAIADLGAEARGFVAASPVREFEPIALSFEGQPGDVILGVLGAQPAAAYVPALLGSLLVEPTGATLFKLGALEATGSLGLSVTAPPVLLGGGMQLALQPLYLDATGTPILGPASAVLLLSQTY